jgi:2-hydroxycyclohexanecarboxyl-CoA dehydrogenase
MTANVRFLEMDEELWDRMIEVNVKGPFLCARAILPDMLAAGWGRVINISSSSTRVTTAGRTAYVTSKGGINGFSRALAMEFADQGITVNTVAPGYVDTPRLRKWALNMEAMVKTFPMKRAGKPEEVAAACAFIASEEASYITGQLIHASGGRYLS